MAKVNTVLGPVSVDELGVTLMHEHLVFSYLGWECALRSQNTARNQRQTPKVN